MVTGLNAASACTDCGGGAIGGRLQPQQTSRLTLANSLSKIIHAALPTQIPSNSQPPALSSQLPAPSPQFPILPRLTSLTPPCSAASQPHRSKSFISSTSALYFVYDSQARAKLSIKNAWNGVVGLRQFSYY